MQLRNARLCLDCEEVHDAAHCPACASESFAFITRWVPAPSLDAAHGAPAGGDRTEGRPRPRTPEPPSAEALDTYRQMLSPPGERPASWRTVKRGAVGLALFGLAGWAWRQQRSRGSGNAARESSDQGGEAAPGGDRQPQG